MTYMQSIVDRVVFINKDPTFTRWTLDEILAWARDGIDQVASIHPRSASVPVTLTLKAGARQDLRLIDPAKRWIRLHELTCNIVNDLPVGGSIRVIARQSLDFSLRTWRNKNPENEVREYAMDERAPFTFDVYPPVQAGTQVLAMAAIKPAAIEDEDSLFPLADGYDIPVVDYVLFRLFSKDASDPSYAARAISHMQAFTLAMGVETTDAASQ